MTTETDVDLSTDPFADIEERFALEASHRILLECGRAAYARWRAIKETVDREGLLVPGRYEGSSRPHPLLNSEIRARAEVARFLRELGI